jgi:hypothetical protein
VRRPTPEQRADATLRGLAVWGLVDLTDPETVLEEARLRRYYAAADRPSSMAELAGAFVVLEQVGVDGAEALATVRYAMVHVESEDDSG